MADAPEAHPPWAGRLSKYVLRLHSLQLNIKKKYIGSTSDLKERLKRHNSGRSNFTSEGGPWKIVYYSAFSTKTDALCEEKFLKSGKGRKRIKYLLKGTFQHINI